MQEKEFNLLDENWIRVRLPDNSVREVSLTDALLNAQNYADLAGEMATQDAAMIRLLIAFPLTIFYRVNPEGKDDPLKTVDQALIRWNELWKMGHFPQEAVKKYLEKWRDRFWLFHPERPFWQVAGLHNGIEFDAKKLNGERAQSGNKIPLFQGSTVDVAEKLSYAQAARWLIYQNGYDERGGRPKAGNKPRHGVGWLGQIGFVEVKGKTLFETIMRNMVLPETDDRIKEEPRPYWELEKVRIEQSTEILVPKNQPELLTTQFRRIILRRAAEENCVRGYEILGGDYWEGTNAFDEKMTIWRKSSKKGEKVTYLPKRHDTRSQLWREFSSLVQTSEYRPGVISWNIRLQKLGFLKRNENITIQAIGIQYDDQGASIKDVYSDQLMMELAVMDNLGKAWPVRINAEVVNCENVSYVIEDLAENLARASGERNDHVQGIGDNVRTQFYFLIDQPFRYWLSSIDADNDDPDEKTVEWRDICCRIAADMAKDMIRKAGETAFVGRKVKVETGKNSDTAVLYTAPKAYNKFQVELRKIYPKDEK